MSSPIFVYVFNLFLVFLLVFFNAFFVVSEFSIVKIRRTKLEELAQNGRTGYRYLAQMETAGILMSGTEKERGLGILKDLADNTSAPVPLREAAMVSYVGHRLNSANQAELQAYLLPILKRPESAFFGEASELSALMSMLAGQKEVAVGTIQKALAVETIMPTVRERLTALLREMEK